MERLRSTFLYQDILSTLSLQEGGPMAMYRMPLDSQT